MRLLIFLSALLTGLVGSVDGSARAEVMASRESVARAVEFAGETTAKATHVPLQAAAGSIRLRADKQSAPLRAVAAVSDDILAKTGRLRL